MKKSAQILFISSLFSVLVAIITLGGLWFISQRTAVIQAAEENVSYTNNELHFQLTYPKIYDQVTESSNQVLFDIKNDEGISGFRIKVEDTVYSSVEEWVAAQPQGSDNAAGYEMFADLGGDTFLVAEYVVTDHDGGTPLYSRILFGLKIENGRMYRLDYRNEMPVPYAPQLMPEMVDIANSLVTL